jgi:thermitase
MLSRRPARACVVAVTAFAALGLLAPAASAAAYDPDTVLVKFRPGTPGKTQTAALGVPGVGQTVGRIDALGTNVVRVRQDPADVAQRLRRHPNVEYAEVNRVLRTSARPNDALFGDQYALDNAGQTGGTADADIDAPEGWAAAGLGAFPNTGGVRVGVIDTGIDRLHPDLSGKLAGCATSYTAGVAVVPGVCDDDNGHGTHVAGTISANTNNGAGVAGVAFRSPLVVCKALATAAGTGLTSDIANCLDWTSRQGVKVVNMSLGGGASETLKRSVEQAAARGVLLVAAAGNDGDATANYPAVYPEVVSVAATDSNDRRASFSNANATVELAAPGVDILSTFVGTLYLRLSGTSMASPHVAGVAAEVFAQRPAATAAQVRDVLRTSVDDLGPAGRDQQFGHGRINLCLAMGGGCSYTPGRN